MSTFSLPKPPTRQRRVSDKILRRRREIVSIFNNPFCVLLNRSHYANILKCSSNTVTRDLEFLSRYYLLFPLLADLHAYTPTETAPEYNIRFLAVHGLIAPF